MCSSASHRQKRVNPSWLLSNGQTQWEGATIFIAPERAQVCKTRRPKPPVPAPLARSAARASLLGRSDSGSARSPCALARPALGSALPRERASSERRLLRLLDTEPGDQGDAKWAGEARPGSRGLSGLVMSPPAPPPAAGRGPGAVGHLFRLHGCWTLRCAPGGGCCFARGSASFQLCLPWGLACRDSVGAVLGLLVPLHTGGREMHDSSQLRYSEPLRNPLRAICLSFPAQLLW
ncbi:hypothetical protein NN561_005898 [Cricetulus griseus]